MNLDVAEKTGRSWYIHGNSGGVRRCLLFPEHAKISQKSPQTTCRETPESLHYHLDKEQREGQGMKRERGIFFYFKLK